MELMEPTGIQEVEKESTATTPADGTSWGERLYCWQLEEGSYDEWLPKLTPFFLRLAASTDGELAPDSYPELIRRGTFQCFLVWDRGVMDFIVVTEFITYPAQKMLRIVGISGRNPLRFKYFWEHFLLWAKENGAAGIETVATPETVKLNERFGMSVRATVMRHFFEEK